MKRIYRGNSYNYNNKKIKKSHKKEKKNKNKKEAKNHEESWYIFKIAA